MKFKALFLIPILLFSLCLVGCKDKKNYRVSQLRTDILQACEGELCVTAYAEEREIPLCADGYAGERSPVVIIKITDSSAFSGAYSALLTIGGREYTSSLSQQMPNVLRAEIPVDKLPNGELAVQIQGEKSLSITLRSVLPDGIATPDEALSSAVNALGDKVSYDKNTAEGEFFIRVLLEDGTPYWYVGYTRDKNTHSLLISADGERVIAER